MKNREEIKKKIQSMSEEQLVDLFINNENNKIENDWYKEQLALLNKQRYSSTSEKVIVGQLNLFNEVEDINDTPVIEATVKKVKKKKAREANISKLPTKTIEHELEDKHCEVCGTEMKELAPQIIDVLKFQPARYTIERHIVHQYICPTCTDENLEAEIVVAEGAPKRLIKGSVVSPSVVAGIAFNKYVSGTPLYRQEQELKRKKIEISRSNMSNWLMKSGELMKPLMTLMEEDIRKQSHVHMDETTVVVLEDKKTSERDKSYMWMMASGKNEEHQIVIYRYHESREYEFAKEMIGEDYSGSIHCDAYESYHKFDKATALGCMAHARRYFVQAMEVSPLHEKAKKLKDEQLEELCKENPSYGNTLHVVSRFKMLFAYEALYKDEGLSPSQIKKRRQDEQKPILDELFKCLEKHQGEYTTKSKMGKAITYALNQRKYLMNYLNDGEAEISNNRGERYIKPFVTGRKAWLFSNTKSGAEMSSIFYSLIESAKQNHLDIYGYLEHVLTQIQDNPELSDYRVLLPYAKELPNTIRVNQ